MSRCVEAVHSISSRLEDKPACWYFREFHFFMELAIPLQKTGEPLFRQVYRGLRQAILTGNLPSPRTPPLHARSRGTARNFAHRGPACVRPTARRRVRRRPRRIRNVRVRRLGRSASREENGAPPKSALSHFGHGCRRCSRQSILPDGDRLRCVTTSRMDEATSRPFGSEMWRRILLRHVRMAPVRQFDYGAAVGSLDLRAAICAHVRRSRAVVCDPSEVIVVNGSQQGLDLIARVLVERGDRVVIEDPHYDGTAEKQLLRRRSPLDTGSSRSRWTRNRAPPRSPEPRLRDAFAPVSDGGNSFARAPHGLARVGPAQELGDRRERS